MAETAVRSETCRMFFFGASGSATLDDDLNRFDDATTIFLIDSPTVEMMPGHARIKYDVAIIFTESPREAVRFPLKRLVVNIMENMSVMESCCGLVDAMLDCRFEALRVLKPHFFT